MSLGELLLEPFALPFMQRGLAAAVLVGLSGGALGSLLVLRRLALMGDALSHSLLPGLALAYLFFGQNVGALLVGALLAGLLTASGGALLSRLTRLKEDAAFGALFIVFFAAGIALVSHYPSRLDLAHFLFGSILGVGPEELRFAALVSTITIALLLWFRRSLALHAFDPAFHRATGGRGGLVHVGLLALVVFNLISALQVMGIVLSLGLFILPAVTAYLWVERLAAMMLLSGALAALGATVGLLLSFHVGVASGAAIVLTLGAFFLGSALLSPRHGLAAPLLARWRTGKRVLHRPD